MIEFKDRVGKWGTDRVVISFPRDEFVPLAFAASLLRLFGRSLTDERLWSLVGESHRLATDQSKTVRLDIALQIGAGMPDAMSAEEVALLMGKSVRTIQRMVHRGELKTTTVNGRVKIIPNQKVPSLSAFELEVLRAIRSLGVGTAQELVNEINRRREVEP